METHCFFQRQIKSMNDFYGPWEVMIKTSNMKHSGVLSKDHPLASPHGANTCSQSSACCCARGPHESDREKKSKGERCKVSTALAYKKCGDMVSNGECV